LNNQLDKAAWRQSLLKIRQSMSQEEWQQKSDRICYHLQSSSLFTQAKTILAYFSFRREPNLSPLLTINHYRWGVSRCVEKNLIWHAWKTGDALQKGAYGILEPLPHAPILQPEEVDLILVPAVACDYQAYRLGYGGGYYDRLLSSPAWASKPTIGIVFHFAYLPQLPTEAWDVQLHGVCTETGLKMIK
jgi:5-formyltetrahydrofolate cyclo-ligase